MNESTNWFKRASSEEEQRAIENAEAFMSKDDIMNELETISLLLSDETDPVEIENLKSKMARLQDRLRGGSRSRGKMKREIEKDDTKLDIELSRAQEEREKALKQRQDEEGR
jgi:hypothetical protein